jgi:hypothetical protein
MDDINKTQSLRALGEPYVNDLECREPRGVEPSYIDRSIVPDLTPDDGRRFRNALMSFGVGALVVTMGFIIYMAVG